MKGFSFFEVDKKSEADVLQAFSENVIHSGRRVTVDIARPESAADRYSDQESTYKRKGESDKGNRYAEKDSHGFKRKNKSDFKKKGNKKKHRGQ